jgi:uncharacterized protein
MFAGIFLNLFGLPGTAVIFIDVLLYSIFTGFHQIGWGIILFLLVSALIAETIDFFWGIETSSSVISRKSVVAAIAGSIAGALLLTPLFWGPGTWIGFFSGGLSGMLILEIIRPSGLKAPYRTMNQAVFAMAGKKIIKGFISLCMIAFSLSNIYS